MHVRRYLVFSLCLAFGFCFSYSLNAEEPPVVEVIISDAYPVTGVQTLKRQGIQVRVYNLDDGKRLLSRLGSGLPKTQEAAKKNLQQRFNKMGDAAVKSQFTQAYQAVTLATQYGLARYPAVVFDQGQSVVYGITDLPRAMKIYQLSKVKSSMAVP